MELRGGPPPTGVKYPFWAWNTIEWEQKKPDLRRIEFRGYSGDQVCIELEVPYKGVLLSNADIWHIVLSDGYYGVCTNEMEYEAEDKWFESLPPEQMCLNSKPYLDITSIDDEFWREKALRILAIYKCFTAYKQKGSFGGENEQIITSNHGFLSQ